MLIKQKTLKRSARFEGIGVHSGKRGILRFKPSPANSGIILQNAADPNEKIEIGKVVPLRAMHATVINNGNGWTVGTIEHVMAAIGGLGIDNIIVEIEGSEFPILDGSSLPFVKELLEIGFDEQTAAKQFITPKDPISFHDEEHNRALYITPAQQNGSGLDKKLYLDYRADFNSPHIPASSLKYCLSENLFVEEIAPARTFGFLEELPFLKKHGLAQGASLDNTVVITKDGFVNKRRFEDECTRHKLLDLLGDLTLLGKSLVGTVKASRTGHSFNSQVVESFIKTPEKWVTI
ncbi:UDP-3-O-[3-hydroxymyristoyl] N-acetylglucosamine deacetylase [Candidatus Babeliales bacterium]|nr:UDP-3-O-[3-hydroxymyristoyl] N-acetylglucosamine deacetylase [Candidatus Babeliales bacterium]